MFQTISVSNLTGEGDDVEPIKAASKNPHAAEAYTNELID
jgi:hypothetical protein